ncbi:hypothetical protein BBJ28_00023966 [Nothophytophthora sp. Chile5]|nr:hypothetical protein BBJ28_00023966 [Nothophytophthora sp. Chile5]
MSLYRDYKKLVPEFFKSELKHYYRGLRRKDIKSIVDGVRSSKAGKDGMPFDLYKFIASHMISEPSSEFVFARTFMVLCWNLMARAESALSIRLHQLKFVEDSLCIYYAHTKNDQFGENRQDPRHVYANPEMPEVCPLLSRGVYWLSIRSSCVCESEVESRGVQDTYLRYESAGDVHLSRTVCGLPDDRPEFALLPPRFTADHTAIVARAIDSCFGAVPSSLRLVYEYALVSVFYHRDYLRRVVPASDPLVSTLPFTNGVSSVTQLAKRVVCALPTSKDGLRATGVPPYVSVMCQMRKMAELMEQGANWQP